MDARIKNRLRKLMREMSNEADNLSPFHDDGSGGDAHPAPEIRKWVKVIERLMEKHHD